MDAAALLDVLLSIAALSDLNDCIRESGQYDPDIYAAALERAQEACDVHVAQTVADTDPILWVL